MTWKLVYDFCLTWETNYLHYFVTKNFSYRKYSKVSHCSSGSFIFEICFTNVTSSGIIILRTHRQFYHFLRKRKNNMYFYRVIIRIPEKFLQVSSLLLSHIRSQMWKFTSTVSEKITVFNSLLFTLYSVRITTGNHDPFFRPSIISITIVAHFLIIYQPSLFFFNFKRCFFQRTFFKFKL